MSKPTQPFSSAAAPSRVRQSTLAVATALGGVALAGRHALAQAGGTLGSRAAAIGQDMLNFGSPITMVLYLIAAVCAATGIVAVHQMGRRNAQVNPAVPICAFLAAFIAAGAGTWVVIGSNTVTGSAPSITGASATPIQFQ